LLLLLRLLVVVVVLLLLCHALCCVAGLEVPAGCWVKRSRKLGAWVVCSLNHV
jgi:hypothetical protein